jgi:hypothetical protein
MGRAESTGRMSSSTVRGLYEGPHMGSDGGVCGSGVGSGVENSGCGVDGCCSALLWIGG